MRRHFFMDPQNFSHQLRVPFESRTVVVPALVTTALFLLTSLVVNWTYAVGSVYVNVQMCICYIVNFARPVTVNTAVVLNARAFYVDQTVAPAVVCLNVY